MIVKKSKNSFMNYKLIEDKIITFQNIIRNTIISCQKYKVLDIIGANELNICIQSLENLFIELNSLLYPIQEKIVINENSLLNNLQKITNELSSIIKTFGTQNIDDLIIVCLGSDFIEKNLKIKELQEKYELIAKYTHPINYKILSWKKGENSLNNTKNTILQKNKIIEDCAIVELSNILDCFDLARTSKSFQTRVYGIKISIQEYMSKTNNDYLRCCR